VNWPSAGTATILRNQSVAQQSDRDCYQTIDQPGQSPYDAKIPEQKGAMKKGLDDVGGGVGELILVLHIWMLEEENLLDAAVAGRIVIDNSFELHVQRHYNTNI
jgi:hypothetical protein